MTYVLVPGARAGGWVWDAVAAELRERGRAVQPLTLPGLEFDGYAGDVGLPTRVDAVIDHIVSRDLVDAVLVCHSYSGIVVGQVSTRLRTRVVHSLFVEAFLPVDGRSLLDVSGLDANHERRLIDDHGCRWPAPTLEELEAQLHLTTAAIGLLVSKQRGQPGRTVADAVRLAEPLTTLRATFISEAGSLATFREADLLATLRNQLAEMRTSGRGATEPRRRRRHVALLRRIAAGSFAIDFAARTRRPGADEYCERRRWRSCSS